MSDIYPWHENAWQQINQRIAAGRLAHGLLFTGPAGTGTGQFARQLAETLLGADDKPRARALLDAGSHPDLRVLEPPEPGKAIRVEAVREMIEFLSLTPQYGDRKVAIILQAESMNRHAANSLLKTLEEPPSHSQLILVSQQPVLLPITIRSRCQKLELAPHTGTQTEAWLRQQLDDSQADAGLLLAVSGNAPLAACELSGETGLPLRNELIEDLVTLSGGHADTVAIADRWNKAGALAVYAWLYRLCCDLVRCRLLGPEAVANRDLKQQLSHLTADRSLRQVIDYYDLVMRNYHLLTGPYSPNAAVLLEDFILHWQGVLEKKAS